MSRRHRAPTGRPQTSPGWSAAQPWVATPVSIGVKLRIGGDLSPREAKKERCFLPWTSGETG